MLFKEKVVALLWWGFLLPIALFGRPRGRAVADEVGIDLLKPEVCAALDELTNAYRDGFDSAKVGIGDEGIPSCSTPRTSKTREFPGQETYW